MKLLTVFGTRPEIIRLSIIVRELDRWTDQVLLDTGQNFEDSLSGLFLRELKVREPDVQMGIRENTAAAQIARIIGGVDSVMEEKRPDALLILGDTNSGLAALPAARRGIPVFHLEAGNRAYDDRIPEEINRRVIDQCSSVLLPYTHRSKENLIREGFDRTRIFVVGNPIFEVLSTYSDAIEASQIVKGLDLEPRGYLAASLHRSENVDDVDRLALFLSAFDRVVEAMHMPLIVSVHPRTADRMSRAGLEPRSDAVRLIPPLGLFDWVALEKSAHCVLTDSGTVQEECCIFGVPNVTIRDVTERPETLESGSNLVTGSDPSIIVDAVRAVSAIPGDWIPPVEYTAARTSATVAKIILSVHRRG